MAEVNNEILKIGDIVTLKLNPEFRGVIVLFRSEENNVMNGVNELYKNITGFLADIGFFDENGKQIFVQYPLVHLRLVERP